MFPVRYGLPTVYLCVPYGSHSKQRLFPHTALTGWALLRRRDVFPMRCELSFLTISVDHNLRLCIASVHEWHLLKSGMPRPKRIIISPLGPWRATPLFLNAVIHKGLCSPYITAFLLNLPGLLSIIRHSYHFGVHLKGQYFRT
jgi:hypothetical protein